MKFAERNFKEQLFYKQLFVAQRKKETQIEIVEQHVVTLLFIRPLSKTDAAELTSVGRRRLHNKKRQHILVTKQVFIIVMKLILIYASKDTFPSTGKLIIQKTIAVKSKPRNEHQSWGPRTRFMCIIITLMCATV